MAIKYLWGTINNDVLRAADDGYSYRIKGNDGNDWLFGNDQSDELIGGNGNDLMSGGAGSDILAGGQGDDAYLGGTGFDKAVLGNGNNRVDLRNTKYQNTNEGSDLFLDIEAVHGGGGNDSLIGNAQGNLLEGGTGDDWLFGLAGSDRLDGGSGKDHLIGGSGFDVMTGGSGADRFYNVGSGAADLITDFRDTGDFLTTSKKIERVVEHWNGDGLLVYSDDSLLVWLQGTNDVPGLTVNDWSIEINPVLITGNGEDYIFFEE